MRIDIERVIDAVVDEMTCYNAYVKQSKELYGGTLAEFPRRKDKLKELLSYHDMAQTAMWAIMEVLKMDADQKQRLYVVARAVERWRKQTNYAYVMPEQMQKQVEQFIWGR